MAEIDAKEKLLLEFALSSKDLFIKVMSVMQPEYFDKPLDKVVGFVKGYFSKYHNIPEFDVIEAETGVPMTEREVAPDDFDYATDEIEIFCQKMAMRNAILEGADLLTDDDDDEPNFGQIDQLVRNALSVSIDKDLGISVFKDAAIRLMQMQETIESRSIGWPKLDLIIDQVRRSEMLIFAANSGGGKSVFLSNVAYNMAFQKMNVLYISLELNQALVSKRMDSIITGIAQKEIFDKVEDIAQLYTQMESQFGDITVKRLPTGSTANDFRTYLLEYHLQNGFYPDAICVDYLDLMAPIAAQGKNAGVFDKDKAISEELRDLFDEINCYGFTASQLNRDSINVKEKSQGHIAGGLSKINTADAVLAIIRTEEDVDNGEVHLQPIKLRNAEMSNQPVTLYWEGHTLRITDKPPAPKAKASTTGTRSKLKGKSNPAAGADDPKQRLNAVLQRGKKT